MPSALKYILLAVGGYMLYRELQKRGALGFIPHHPHHPPPPPPGPTYFPQYGPWMGYGSPPIILQLPSDMTMPGPEDFGIDGVPVKKKTKKKKKSKKDDEDED